MLNKVWLFVFLIVLATYVSLYAVLAYHVADTWALDCTSYWRYSGSMTFFPWPMDSQGVILPVITKMNVADEFIYLYLIKTGILLLICLLMWAFTAVYFFEAFSPLIKAWKHVKIKRV